MPLLGKRAAVYQRRILTVLLTISLLVLAAVAFFVLRQADIVSQQVAATGQSLMQSQRLAKSASQALVGNAGALAG